MSTEAETQTSYLRHVSQFGRFYGQSPERLGPEDIRTYQLHLIDDRQFAPTSVASTVAALRFLYQVTLKREWAVEALPLPKRGETLPVILSPEEVVRFLEGVARPKHRMILTTCYAAGLRLSEALRLQVTDVDSDRRVLHVARGKGARDRYVMLSPSLVAGGAAGPVALPGTESGAADAERDRPVGVPPGAPHMTELVWLRCPSHDALTALVRSKPPTSLVASLQGPRIGAHPIQPRDQLAPSVDIRADSLPTAPTDPRLSPIHPLVTGAACHRALCRAPGRRAADRKMLCISDGNRSLIPVGIDRLSSELSRPGQPASRAPSRLFDGGTQATRRLSVHKLRDVLRLRFGAALCARATACSLRMSPTTVGDYVSHAEVAGLRRPVPASVDDAAMERRPFLTPPPNARSRPLPPWGDVHPDLPRKGVTLSLLWREYTATHPNCVTAASASSTEPGPTSSTS